MKENKKFFDNNHLNKGHKRLSNAKQNEVIRNKFHHVLPPIEMMEHYEELNPGTLDKLLDMAKSEQNHRHSIDLMAMEKHNKATQLGRVFSLVFVAFVSITCLLMIIIGSFVAASVFAFSAFGCITIVSYFYSKNSLNKEAAREKWGGAKNNRGNRNYRKPRN
jgi:uncharacterized membrane protein